MQMVVEEKVVERKKLECPECHYAGFGFRYVELVEVVSEIHDGIVRRDLAERREDADDDRIECPGCQHRFAAAGIMDALTFTR